MLQFFVLHYLNTEQTNNTIVISRALDMRLHINYSTRIPLAVVTGATDGIGREYIKGLAKQKINVVAISRTESKLRELCNELEMEHRVKTKFIVADFSRGRPIYQHIEKELQGIPVGILGALIISSSYNKLITPHLQSTTWARCTTAQTTCTTYPRTRSGTS